MTKIIDNSIYEHKIAIFGATGYIGIILSELLAKSNISIKLFVRNKRRIKYLLKKHKNISFCDIELEQNNTDKISQALKGYDTTIYLIHSMTKETELFDAKDRTLATIVSNASKMANIKNIVYLSGLGTAISGHKLSAHLQSRQDTAKSLRSSGIPVTELRAGVILGAGSASFEIIRNLATKMPIMPKLTIETGLCQPIDVDSVIQYILEAICNKKYYGNTIEIGSDDVMKYSEMVKIFSNEIKHRKIPYIKIPFIEKLITKNLISWVISRATSLPIELTKPLIGGIDSYAIVDKYPVSKIDPNSQVKPLSYLESIKIASDRENTGQTISLWGLPIENQVYDKKESSYFKYDAHEINGLLYEERNIKISTDEIEKVFSEIKRIGGKHGYWSPHWLWKIRGYIDTILGGPGLSGRIRNYSEVREGERLDFWTISRFIDRKDFKKLRVKARMKSPGNAWLEFTIITKDKFDAEFVLRAYYEPSGIFGYIYWYSLYFIHKYMFSKMIHNIYNFSKHNGQSTDLDKIS